MHAGDPCPGPDGDADCSESCDEATNKCTANDPNGSPCDDGVFCNGADTCQNGSCKVHAGDPCPGPDGDADCAESCDETTSSCTASDPDGSSCNDGVFCNGADTCQSGLCSVHAGDPCPGPDGDTNCSESCDEAADSCTAPDPDGTLCRPGSGDSCDPDETCSGGVCPPDVVAPVTTVCRASAGPCDLAEACPGVAGQACPADALAASGSLCATGSGSVCDPGAQCDGTDPTCPERTLFFDSFNRADGTLGPKWQSSGAAISGQEVCGEGEGTVIKAHSAANVRVSFTFVPHSSGPQGYGATADQDAAVVRTVGMGQYELQLTAPTDVVVTGDPFPLPPNVPYELQAIFDNAQVTVTLFDASGALVSTLTLPMGASFSQFGFIITDCIDNFLVEDLCPNATPTTTATSIPTQTLTPTHTPTRTPTPTVPCLGCLDPLGASCAAPDDCLSANCTGGACACGNACVAGITQILDSTGDGTHHVSDPHRIAVDGAGNVYVTNSDNNNVFKIAVGGVITVIIDHAGDGPHALTQPHGVAVDGAGNVYVTAQASNNVFKISRVGPIVQIIGSTGDGTHPLNDPTGIAVDGLGNVYVTGTGSDNAFEISPAGPITQIIDATGDGTHALNGPSSVAVDGAGNVYVTGSDSNNAFEIPSAGPIRQIIATTGDGTHTLSDPLAIAVDGASNVYVTGLASNNAFKIPPSGPITQIIGSTGDGSHPLNSAFAVTTDSTGNVYVSGQTSSNVFEIPPSGPITQIIGPPGDGTHALNFPAGLAVDGAGFLYVVGEISNNAFKISGLCGCPTPTPTATSTVTATPTPTATATSTPTQTATPCGPCKVLGPTGCGPVADGTSCDDGLFCNGTDTCQGGSCSGHNGDPCPLPHSNCQGACDEGSASCTDPDPAGTLCRAVAGACDVAETCVGTGIKVGCPADAFAQAGTACIATCGVPGTCTGSTFDCPANMAGATDAIFSDDFNRADDNSLGSNWQSFSSVLPTPVISGQQACGYDHGAAVYDQSISAPSVRVSFDFVSSTNGGFEVFAAAQTSSGDAYYAGCDNGLGGGICVLTIGIVSGNNPLQPLVTGEMLELTKDVTYHLQAVFDNGQVALTILDSSNTTLSRLGYSSAASFTHYGAIIGRNATELHTCIDNFLLENLCPNAPTGTPTATPTATPTQTATPCGPCTVLGPTGCGPVADGTSCDDGLFCDGTDTCQGGSCSGHSGDPCPLPHSNCQGACDEGSASCTDPDPAGTLCRAVAGACDVAETCVGTGIKVGCPADAFAQAGTACIATCGVPGTCTGSTFDCPANMAGATDAIFSDDFNRADGSLGPNWQLPEGFPTPFATPVISGQQACGYDHGVAVYDQSVSATSVRLSFDFVSSTNGGFEVFAAAQAGSGDAYYAGCDGSTNGFCTPTIGTVTASNQPQSLATGAAIALSTSVTYRLQAVFDNGQVALTILDSSNTTLGQLGFSTGGTFTHFGVVIGRNATELHTCIDNFLLENLCPNAPTRTPTATPTATPTETATPCGPCKVLGPTGCGPVADGTSCDDGLFCNGTDTCQGGSCSGHSGDPCPLPHRNCVGACDETTASCTDPDPAGTLCRAVAGACDVAETCTTSGRCPADAFVQAGTACTATCGVPGTCTGSASDCPANMAGATNAIFSDDFTRADGSLGPNWQLPEGFPTPFATPVISGQQACGYDHGVAVYDQSVSATSVRLSFDFDATNDAGFEVFAVAQAGSGDAYYAGCDGSTNGFCTPTIGTVTGSNQPQSLATGAAIALSTSVTYRLQAVFDNGQVALTILDSSNTTLGQLGFSTGATFTHFGVVIGRNATAPLTCIDDFLLEDLCPNAPTASPTPTPPATPTQTPGVGATATATNTVPSTATATQTRTNPSLPTSTPTRTTTPTGTPTRTPGGVLIDPATAFSGSRVVGGSSSPDCPQQCTSCDGRIHVYDCGPEKPPICYNGDDVEIATCDKVAGFYSCLLSAPLLAGHIIYATDGCFDPPLVGPSQAVAMLETPAPAPALSPAMLIAAAAMLAAIARRSVRRRRRAGSKS